MKRIKIFAAILITFLTISAAKAQVGVHVGLNFGTPYYHHVYAPAYGYGYGPRYYHPVPAYGYGYYGPHYYAPAPVVVYRQPYYRGGYYRHYRRW